MLANVCMQANVNVIPMYSANNMFRGTRIEQHNFTLHPHTMDMKHDECKTTALTPLIDFLPVILQQAILHCTANPSNGSALCETPSHTAPRVRMNDS